MLAGLLPMLLIGLQPALQLIQAGRVVGAEQPGGHGLVRSHAFTSCLAMHSRMRVRSRDNAWATAS